MNKQLDILISLNWRRIYSLTGSVVRACIVLCWQFTSVVIFTRLSSTDIIMVEISHAQNGWRNKRINHLDSEQVKTTTFLENNYFILYLYRYDCTTIAVRLLKFKIQKIYLTVRNWEHVTIMVLMSTIITGMG